MNQSFFDFLKIAEETTSADIATVDQRFPKEIVKRECQDTTNKSDDGSKNDPDF